MLRNSDSALNEHSAVSPHPSPSTLPVILVIFRWSDFSPPPFACAAVSWCDGCSPPSGAFGSADWIRRIFQRRPAVRNIAAHTNTFQSLDGPDTHTHTHISPPSPQKIDTCTHKTSPLTLTSLYTLCVILQGLTEPPSVCVCVCVAVCFSVLRWPRC